MGYKILGFVVWNGGKWYVRRRVAGVVSRRGMAVAIVGVAVVGLAVSSSRRASS